MKLLKILSLASFVFVLSACGGNPADKAAAKMCKCAKPLIGFKEKMEKSPDKALEIMAEMESTIAEMESCSGSIEKQVKDKGEEFGKEIQGKMEKKCPKVYEAMRN